MAASNKKKKAGIFEKVSVELTKFSGSTTAFISALIIILLWSLSGPFFHYSETWQLVINTGTTIITFLMVFLIQRTQNKDSIAVQLKLNELIAAMEGASNRLIDIEDLSEYDLDTLKKHYAKLVKLFDNDFNIRDSHSVEEAEKRHYRKLKTGKN
jgi:low affinity Fe/Cu permease